MDDRLLFVIGTPRSGTTMLQRMLGSHTRIFTLPEPHIITPLAHLGYFGMVDKAPFDHINAAQAIREFVADLPEGEDDYVAACKAYTNVLYGRMLEGAGRGRRYLLDKTPAYGLVLPFLSRLYPAAHYVVLTRHPLAILSSYAGSFFDGNYERALAFNNILGSYVPAMADFLRRQDVAPIHHVRYEDLVSAPDRHMDRICSFLSLDFEPGMVDYGKHQHITKSYGDPKVKHHSRPTTASKGRWAQELANDSEKLRKAHQAVDSLDPADLDVWGYDAATLFDPVAEAAGEPVPSVGKKWQWDSYRLRRKVFMALRKDIHDRPHGRLLKKVKYYVDVLLRD